jgi:hypothetical protein
MSFIPEVDLTLDEDTIFVSSPPTFENAESQQSSELSNPPSDTITLDSSPPSSESSFSVSKRRWAWIWKHMPDPSPYTIYRDRYNRSVWKCYYCPRVYRESGGTRIISQHLRQNHRIHEFSKREERQQLVQKSIQQAMATAERSNHKRRRICSDDDDNDSFKPIDPAVLEVLTVKWLASCHLPLHIVDCSEFKALTTYLNAESERWFGCGNTVKEWVFRTKTDQQEQQQVELSFAKSKVHLIIDCWSTNSHDSVMGFIAQYVNRHWKLVTEPISLQQLFEEHTGVNLAMVAHKVIDQWGIQGNFGTLMMDNASNMDKFARELSICKL